MTNNFSSFKNKLFFDPSLLRLSLLEQKMLEMEMRHREELETLKQEKGSLQALVGSQSGVIRELEAQLSRATGNSTALQRQQQEMMDTVHNLLNLCSKDGGKLTYCGLGLFQQCLHVIFWHLNVINHGKEKKHCFLRLLYG